MPGIPEHRLYQGHTIALAAVSWSPDGRFIASGGDDATVQVWNLVSGECLCIYTGIVSNVQALAWSLNSTLIGSGYYNETAHMWNALTGELLTVYQGHSHEINSVSWSPDGLLIAYASSFGRAVHVWEARTGTFVFSCAADEAEYMDAAWCPDGDTLACAANEEIHLWDVAIRKPVAILPRSGLSIHRNRVYTISWSPDNRFLVSGGRDARVRIWDIFTSQLVQTYEGNESVIHDVAWSPDRWYIASACDDRTNYGVWQQVHVLQHMRQKRKVPGYVLSHGLLIVDILLMYKGMALYIYKG